MWKPNMGYYIENVGFAYIRGQLKLIRDIRKDQKDVLSLMEKATDECNATNGLIIDCNQTNDHGLLSEDSTTQY